MRLFGPDQADYRASAWPPSGRCSGHGELTSRSELPRGARVEEVVRGILDQVAEGGDVAAAQLTSELDRAQITPDTLRVPPRGARARAPRSGPELMASIRRAAANVQAYQEHILWKSPRRSQRGGRRLGVRYSPLRRVARVCAGRPCAVPVHGRHDGGPRAGGGRTRDRDVVATHGRRDSAAGAGAGVGARRARSVSARRRRRAGRARRLARRRSRPWTRSSVPATRSWPRPSASCSVAWASTRSRARARSSSWRTIGGSRAGWPPICWLRQSTIRAPPSWRRRRCALAEQVIARGGAQLGQLWSAASAARRSLERYGAVIVTRRPRRRVRARQRVRHRAPADHHARRRRSASARIDAAGAIFVGAHTPVPLGDYYAGPSHVLPTGGTARFSAPLSCNDFLKVSSLIRYHRARSGGRCRGRDGIRPPRRADRARARRRDPHPTLKSRARPHGVRLNASRGARGSVPDFGDTEPGAAGAAKKQQ